MKVILGYSRFGLELDINKDMSRNEMINAYLQKCGGPQGALDHFLMNVSFIEDTIPDAIIIENNDNDRTDSKKDSN